MKIGTKLDFDVMANPFNIRKLSKEEAIFLIKKNGLKCKKVKTERGGPLYSIKVIGESKQVMTFINKCIQDRIFISDNSIVIK